MNQPKVAVGGLGFVFALNVVQYHCLGIAAFFSIVSVVMIDVHGRLVGEMSGLGCRMSEVGSAVAAAEMEGTRRSRWRQRLKQKNGVDDGLPLRVVLALRGRGCVLW
ncbi:hypothetical protein GOBAR_DD19833 [Gossypium barbadense]|nr:hypothetical protein GOBAR_DD19833 [Gossypium barbadense]